MKTLKTGILILIMSFSCLINVQAQENARGKLKGKIVKSGDTGMIRVDKDTLSNPPSDLGKKGLNAVNVKLARGVDKKDSRKNVSESTDTISNPALRKGWDGSVKGNKTDAEFASKKGYEYYKAHSDDKTIESQRKGIQENGLKKNDAEEASTKVTVPKQTQGATFGEKVNQGLHQAGGAISQGKSTKNEEDSIVKDSIPASPAEKSIKEKELPVKSN